MRAGCLNVVGQFACTSGSGYLTAKHMAVMWQMGNGHVLTPFEMFLSYASEALHITCRVPQGMSYCAASDEIKC